ncbi:uncharacterized protein IL334_004427 [Kwoniella shivajii]|uniref:UDP-N-acetylglucosamine transferase subunit ALG13 n=1 Tax=Kwoniella shivajii TaxID=564305 RepID=A0ABZ1D0P4_9TREE|nr:hypothetical protein IL334_004427 [Kwoniella shivajii]
MSTILVTVGSTLFPSLTDAILSPSLISSLNTLDVRKLVIQYGRADLPPDLSIDVDANGNGTTVIDELRIEVMRFTDQFEKLVGQSDYVISHAGSGSILTTLRRNPPIPLLVVPNESLMDNHQAELADEMGKLGYLMVSRVNELELNLPKFLGSNWKEEIEPFPQMDRERFKDLVDDLMGFT